jgi:hypothetical protein
VLAPTVVGMFTVHDVLKLLFVVASVMVIARVVPL